ncbi:hypothetical protein JCM8097_002623 [Rhodosporidiobolus ruineniae]
MGKRTVRADDEEFVPSSSRRPKVEPTPASSTGSGRKPGRTSVACSQCRGRKSNCSLTGPACEGCLARGEGESCSFQAFLWIDNADDLPSRQLKAKVDRLEELLKGLASPPPSGAPPSPPQEFSPPLKHARANSAPSVLEPPRDSLYQPAAPRPIHRVRAQASIALTRVLFSGDDVPALSVPGIDPHRLSAQLREVEQHHLRSIPFLNHPTPLGLHAVVSPEEYERCVRAVLPTPQQAQVAVSAFLSLANPFLQLIHAPTFLLECDTFWRTGNVPEPSWLATYLLACGGGLMATPDGDTSGSFAALPNGEAKELLARSWMDAGRRVLAANGFMVSPTMEGIRALNLLLHWWFGEGCRYIEMSLGVTAQIVSSLFDLGLNLDPDEVAPHLSLVEKNLRRRLFWSTYCYEAMVRGAIGHPWTPFDEDDISVRYPVLDDVGTGDIPSPLYSAAVLNCRINRLVSRVKVPSREEVTAVLDALETIDGDDSHDVLRSAMIRWGGARLQRFASKAGLTTEAQDELGSRYFQELLGAVETASVAGGGVPTIVLLKIFSVAISAAVELGGTPYALAGMDPTACQLLRLVQELRTRPFPPNVRRIVARGIVILEHVLPAPEEVPPVPASLYSSTASDFSFNSSKVQTPTTAGSGAESFASYPPPAMLQVDQPDPYLPTGLPSPYPTALGDFSATVEAVTYSQMLPPPIPSLPASAIRSTRPSLHLFTSIAQPAVPTKAPTPIAISPWVDAAITPSRYMSGNESWERFF